MIPRLARFSTSALAPGLAGLLLVALLPGCAGEIADVSYGAAALTKEPDGSVGVRSDFVAISTDKRGSLSSYRSEVNHAHASSHNFRTSSDEPGAVTIWLADDKETVKVAVESVGDAVVNFSVVFADGTRSSVDLAFGHQVDVFSEQQSLGVRIDLKPR